MKILVIGCGSIGRRHAANLASINAGEIIVFDPDRSECKAVANEYGTTPVSDLDHAWDLRPDAAVIAAPTNFHVELALDAARHNCHVFIEKPLSHTWDDVDTLCAEIEERQLVSMVGCNMRFHPGPATVKRLLDEGAIGAVLSARIQTGSYLPRWRPEQDYRRSYSAHPAWGGAVLDCIHEIDLALWYLGPAKLIASAILPASSIGLAADGLAELLLKHDSGAISSVHLNFVQRDYRRLCQIIGYKGTIYWDFQDRQVVVFGEDGEIQARTPEPAGWDPNQMYLDEIAHFVHACESGADTMNPVRRALGAQRIALGVRAQETPNP